MTTNKLIGKKLQGNSVWRVSFVAAFFVVAAIAAWPADAATITWVTVDNPGNAADQDYGAGAFGSVGYKYRIGETEVTNDQYAEFLNAIAKSDPNGVWNSFMDISRSGSDGSYSYTVNSGFGPNPVNYASFLNSMRFVNWLENGQPTGPQGVATTEDGSYAISDGLSETRASGASFFLPSEDEWYKAAYHQPFAAGGDTDDYWLYATQSNTASTATTPTATPNSANFLGVVGDTTDVGAYTGTTSYYGGFDFSGNLFEWNESVFSGSFRGLRGGSWLDSATFLAASRQNFGNPAVKFLDVGFRVASPFSETAVIPEPSSVVLGVIGGLLLMLFSGRRFQKRTL